MKTLFKKPCIDLPNNINFAEVASIFILKFKCKIISQLLFSVHKEQWDSTIDIKIV